MLVVRPPTIHKFANALLLREDYFPLTLTLSPIEGEGKKWNRFNTLYQVALIEVRTATIL
jgi:hypothetical protein